MKQRFLLFRRGKTFYSEDTHTRRQESLHTKDKAEASTLLHAKNEAFRQPFLNLRIAQTYLAAADPGIATRTWQNVMEEDVKTKTGNTRGRAERAIKEHAFDKIRDMAIVETRAEPFLRVLENGGVSTNNHLRRLHNLALNMNWLPWPVLPKRQWPAGRYKERRAITREEHEALVSAETNPERRAFYEVCWHLGGAQSDVANLKADDIDWQNQVVSFFRAKTGAVQIVRFGEALEKILRVLPNAGKLFPVLAPLDEKHRASLFQRICRKCKIQGVSLHCCRYAWAERAKVAGYPERFAQMALGHNSKAVHRAYAKKAQVIIPTIEEYQRRNNSSVIPLAVTPVEPEASRS